MKLIIALVFFAVAANASELTPLNVEMPTLYTEQEYQHMLEDREQVKVGENYKPDAWGQIDVARAIKDHPKIINGEMAAVGQFPWQVAITMDNSFFCGGSVISEEWVMTAGHCVDDDSVSSFELVFGSVTTRADAPGTSKQTSRSSLLHEEYIPDLVENDIGLIRLVQPLTLTVGGRINSIRLPAYSTARLDKPGNIARISGWGKISDGFASVSDDLHYADLELLANYECSHVYGSDVIYRSTLCASGTIYSTCIGDVGGPLVTQEEDGQYTQVGIASFSSSAGCTREFPLAFTRVTSYLEWIAATTGVVVRRDATLGGGRHSVTYYRRGERLGATRRRVTRPRRR